MVTLSTGEFDSEKHLLNCQNGVVDLRTGDIRAHRTTDRFTYCVQTDYKPAAKSKLWGDLLQDWFGDDQEIVSYAQRAMGYTITGENREECLFYAYGPGRAGKGTFVNTIAEMLGSPLAQGVQFSVFTGDMGDTLNFRLAPLRSARMATASESRKGDRLNEAIIKNSTGRDAVQAAYKHKDSFSFTPQFKLWMMSNEPPRGDADDDALWNRVRLFAFTKSHLGSEDVTIKDRLSQQSNREGILAWLVAGSVSYYAAGLGTPAQVLENIQSVRQEQDHVYQWITDRCLIKEYAETSTTDLFASYSDWCVEAGVDRAKLSKMGLTQKLSKKGFSYRRTYRAGEQVRLFSGLAILGSHIQ